MKKISTAFILYFITMFSYEVVAEPGLEQTSAGGGEKTCLECHGSDKEHAVLFTNHFVAADSRSPGAQEGCESCHGSSKEHTKFPTKIPSLKFGAHSKTSPEVLKIK